MSSHSDGADIIQGTKWIGSPPPQVLLSYWDSGAIARLKLPFVDLLVTRFWHKSWQVIVCIFSGSYDWVIYWNLPGGSQIIPPCCFAFPSVAWWTSLQHGSGNSCPNMFFVFSQAVILGTFPWLRTESVMWLLFISVLVFMNVFRIRINFRCHSMVT